MEPVCTLWLSLEATAPVRAEPMYDLAPPEAVPEDLPIGDRFLHHTVFGALEGDGIDLSLC